MVRPNHTINGVLAFLAYGFINALFVYKYAARITEHFVALTLAYAMMVGLASWWSYRRRDDAKVIPDWLYFIVAAVLTITLAGLMLWFDPANIRVGRYPALYEWITRLLAGQFPYASLTNPSGFPFLFFLAMPFYFLGDLGFFQIFSFALFAWLVHRRMGSGSAHRLISLGFLVASPIFLYEITTRSDLFSNMVLALFFLEIVHRCIPKVGNWGAFLLGLLGGGILATRGVVLLIYLVAFSFLYRSRRLRQTALIGGLAIGSMGIIAPFALWDWNSFMQRGPFAIQASYVPGWLLLLALIASAIIGWRASSWRGVILGQAGILWVVIAAAFTMSVVSVGWNYVIFEDGFDISYFGFCLPFLVLGWYKGK